MRFAWGLWRSGENIQLSHDDISPGFASALETFGRSFLNLGKTIVLRHYPNNLLKFKQQSSSVEQLLIKAIADNMNYTFIGERIA